MTPQELIDAPRFVLNSDDDNSTDRGRGAEGPVHTPITIVQLEEGIDPEVVESLKQIGHTVKVLHGYARGTFGRAQIIKTFLKTVN